jgi:hypothetical protein
MDPRIGTELAGHRIEGVIGRGGVSVVYLAEHLRLGRRVALKVLAPHLADDDAFRERFIRESRIAAGLDHPNVITVYDAGEAEGILYISMRYVEGSDLSRLIEAEGSLEPSRTVAILSQIASALDAAHVEGLVHRDVKPANMLIEPSEIAGFDRAYLSDFGISKRTTSREGLTRTGQFVGTVDYVAPEQITGEPVDGRTDVYSLGCVLFQCLSGRVPFAGDSEVATIYSHLHDPPPRLDLGERVAPALDQVLARALAKSRTERFGTCGELIEAARSRLDRVAADGAGSPAMPGDLAPVAGRPPRPGGAHRAASSQRPALLDRRLVAAVSVGVIVVVAVAIAVVARLGEDPAGRGTRSNGSPSVPASPSASGSADTPSETVRLSWSPAFQLERVFGETGRQAILDAVVLEDSVVAVGSAAPGGTTGKVDDAAAWRSPNGQRWEVVRSPSFTGEGDQHLDSIVEFGDVLVAGGWDGGDAAVWVSPDQGRTWSRSPSPAFAGHGPQRIRDLATFGDDLIAIGSSWGEDLDAAAWASTDGVRWRRMDVGDSGGPGEQEMRAGIEFGSSLIAVGLTDEFDDADAAIWVLEDATWSRAGSLAELQDEVMLDVAGGTEGLPLVAVGCVDPVARCDGSLTAEADAAVWTSTDGRLWQRVAPEGGGLAAIGRQVMRAVAVYQGTFVAVGSVEGTVSRDGAVWVSTDGTSWRTTRALAAGLGGLGDQMVRALVVYQRHGVALLGLGVTNEGEFEDGQVWTARRLRA